MGNLHYDEKRGPEGHSLVPYRQGEKSSTDWPNTWAAHHRLSFHHWKPYLKQQGSQDTSEFMQSSSLLMRQQESTLPPSPTSCHWDPGSSKCSRAHDESRLLQSRLRTFYSSETSSGYTGDAMKVSALSTVGCPRRVRLPLPQGQNPSPALRKYRTKVPALPILGFDPIYVDLAF